MYTYGEVVEYKYKIIYGADGFVSRQRDVTETENIYRWLVRVACMAVECV